MPDNLLTFLAGNFFIEAQTVFSWAVFLAALAVYVFKNRPFLKSRISAAYGLLIAGFAAFRVFIFFLETLAQYYVWEKNPFTKILLTQPLSTDVPVPELIRGLFFDNPRGYFFYYVWQHFLLNAFLSFLAAAAFYCFLAFLRKYRARFFGDGEVLLGTLLAFVAGWPGAVLFIPSAFLLTAIFSVARRILWGENYTTLGWPFLISAFAVLTFGKFLIDAFRLGVLG